MTPIIETYKLSRRFGKIDAVQDLDLSVPEGSVFAFLGPNGAGKTTTIKMLVNLLEPTDGDCRVMGTPSRRLGNPEFQKIGYVSENQQLPEWMEVRYFLAYCATFYPGWDSALCRSLLKEFQLNPDQKIQNLSRGQRMKLSLLSSIAYRPRLLILDEPFAGLDPLSREDFVSGMLETAERDGWSVFISSHDIEEVERLADWVGVIHDGRLKLSESIESLQARMRKIIATVPGLKLDRAALAPEWINVKAADNHLELVHTNYRPEVTEAELRNALPQFTHAEAFPLSLRELYVSLARQYSIQ